MSTDTVVMAAIMRDPGMQHEGGGIEPPEATMMRMWRWSMGLDLAAVTTGLGMAATGTADQSPVSERVLPEVDPRPLGLF